MSDEETREITVQMSPLALLDDVNLEQVMSAKLVPSEKHIYSFQQQGSRVVGVSIDGVRDAARALSTKGEAIRELWVRMDREDEREAFFTACAARYAIAPDGREICMDTAIRAKRQPKFGKKANGQGAFFIDAWYEIGVAKAVRNATEALLPEALKAHMIAQAEQLRRGGGNAPQSRTSQSSDNAEARRAAQHYTGQDAPTPQQVSQEAVGVVRAGFARIVKNYAPQVAKQLVERFGVEGKRTESGNPAWARYTPEELDVAARAIAWVERTGNMPTAADLAAPPADDDAIDAEYSDAGAEQAALDG